MKLPSTFKIDLSRNKPCTEGGINHIEEKMFDQFGRHVGYQCKHCVHRIFLKRRKRKVTSKITL